MSNYIGVFDCSYKGSRQFAPKLKHHSQTINLPYADNEVIAAYRYDAAVQLLRGEQEPGALNFPKTPWIHLKEMREFLILKGHLEEEETEEDW